MMMMMTAQTGPERQAVQCARFLSLISDWLTIYGVKLVMHLSGIHAVHNSRVITSYVAYPWSEASADGVNYWC